MYSHTMDNNESVCLPHLPQLTIKFGRINCASKCCVEINDVDHDSVDGSHSLFKRFQKLLLCCINR